MDVTSVSFGMIELHDKNYLNDTSSGPETEHSDGDDKDKEEHEYFSEGGDEDESMAKRYKRWQTEQPHFVTK